VPLLYSQPAHKRNVPKVVRSSISNNNNNKSQLPITENGGLHTFSFSFFFTSTFTPFDESDKVFTFGEMDDDWQRVPKNREIKMTIQLETRD
jgi:hypothetical protein